MKVNKNHFSEIKALIEAGDVDLTERRAVFLRKSGRNTDLDDDKLTAAVAATDDDDDALFVKNVIKVEAEGYELV